MVDLVVDRAHLGRRCLGRRKVHNPSEIIVQYPRNRWPRHLLLLLLVRCLRLLPLVQGSSHILSVPLSLHYLLPLQMESRYPIRIFLLPLFLAWAVDIDRLEIEWSLETS